MRARACAYAYLMRVRDSVRVRVRALTVGVFALLMHWGLCSAEVLPALGLCCRIKGSTRNCVNLCLLVLVRLPAFCYGCYRGY